jgi:hypothetical protein
MANPSPISISDQASLIQGTLDQWAQQNGGIARIVPNLKQLYLQSAMDTQSLRILIAFGGTRRRGSFSTANVTKGEAPTAERGEFLTEQTGNTDPFLKEVETIRDIFRWIPNISQEAPANDYEGIEPMAINDTQMSGYLITGTTAHDMPQPTPATLPV